ncbi:MAG: hypothetical protein L0210_12670 [Rhodospirillales bacterium]|nr:hypothetical protein [Rhodospirillales bacterium]
MSFRLALFAALGLSLVAPGPAFAGSKERASAAAPAKPAQKPPAPDPAKLCAKPKPPGAEAGTLAMTGVITKGAKPIKEPISWTVTRISGECRGQVVATKKAPVLEAALDPGNYRVQAQYETAEASTQVQLGKKQKVKQQIDFRAATVTFRMIPHSGAPAIKQPVSWKVYEYVKGNGGIGRQIGEGMAAHQRFLLREGAYVVRATYVDTVTDLVVPVKSGDAFNYTVNLYSGKVKLKAVDKKKKAISGEVVYEITRARPGPDGNHQVLATRTSPDEPLILREGKYVVTARAGDKTGKTEIDVKAGKTKNVVVTIR